MIGTVISHYRVQRLLGTGGMGEVYEAVDEQLGRHVAIKVLLPRFAEDPETTARFFNEARSVNLIGHPGLVQIFEFGRMPSGGAFLVMEYLAGVTLSARLHDSPRLPEMDALQIALQLASALTATHAKNIVHRDLKPGNVMILPDPTMPAGERIKLLDFGIAKLGAESASTDQPSTRTGISIGTPTYMSPEQCRGAKTLDGKADVYSLGVILYQMLAGRLPFDAEGEGEMLGKHMYVEPLPLLRFAPNVSRPVVSLVNRMLGKKAEQRPSAKEVEEVLREMAAAVIPPSARPSAKLKIIAPPQQASGADVPAVNLSTLGGGVGQMSLAKRLRLRLRLSPAMRLAGLGLGALAVALVVGLVLRSRPAEQPSVTPSPAKVRWTLRSLPVGAQVIRKQDQAVLGQTPWVQEQAAAAGTLDVVLRLDGYKDRGVVLQQDHDTLLSETLEPSVAAQAAAAETKSAERPGESAAGRGKGSAKRGSHARKTKLID